jgi:hypothetical protein
VKRHVKRIVKHRDETRSKMSDETCKENENVLSLHVIFAVDHEL